MAAYASSIRFVLIKPSAEMIYPPPGPVVVCRDGLLGVMLLLGVWGLTRREWPCCGIAPVGGTTLIGGRLMMAFSISLALIQRCSIAGAKALMITCSKAIEISGRNVRTSGKAKILGLLLAAS